MGIDTVSSSIAKQATLDPTILSLSLPLTYIFTQYTRTHARMRTHAHNDGPLPTGNLQSGLPLAFLISAGELRCRTEVWS